MRVGPLDGDHLHRRHLVFGAVGRPVGIVGGDDIGLRVRVMEGGVDHARRDAVGDQRAQRGLAGAAGELDPVAVADAALLGVVGMDFEPVLLVPDHIRGAPRLRADIVLAQDAARWSAAAGSAGRSSRRSATYSVMTNLPLPRTKPSICMTGVPSGAFSLHGHCTEPSSSSFS